MLDFVNKSKSGFGFTLAEVLITLGIIGVVAAITIPVIQSKIQDEEYKTAYRKAYSDLSQAMAQAIQEQVLIPRTGSNTSEASASEWAVIKNAFKVAKSCDSNNLFQCWVDAELICTGACNGNLPVVSSKGFVDASGRAWVQYHYGYNIFLVDTNGSKNPNKFGKDRWIFTLCNANNTRTLTGLPVKVGIYWNADITQTSKHDWCNSPPCYYRSWLFGAK